MSDPHHQSSKANFVESSWAFWGPEPMNVYKSAALTVGPTLCRKWPDVQLHFAGICASTYWPSIHSFFPNSNLTSCKVAAWEGHQLPWTWIGELLFEPPNLRELHLVHGKPWTFEQSRPKIVVHDDRTFKQLPALKTLIIEGYDWNHSPWENCNLWNWSSITHIELRHVAVHRFLHHVPHQDLSGLKIFIEKQHSADSNETQRERKTQLLCSLIRHTTALEQLEIECHTQKSDIVSSIAQNGSHIRTLSLLCIGWRFSGSWTPLTVDQLRTIGSSCPQLMEIEVDLTLPPLPHTLPAIFQSTSTIAPTPASTVVTRSKSRVENPKLEAYNTNRGHSRIGELREGASERRLPSWYSTAYFVEKYQEPSYICPDRKRGQLRTAGEQRKHPDEVEDEYLNWKWNHRKEEVAAALKDSIHDDPTPALAEFRNLRRLKIYTRVYYFVAPEYTSATFSRMRETVQHWLNELLQMKTGASFEEVVFHVESEVMNAEINFKMTNLESIYTYTGERNSDGDAKICEDRSRWDEMSAEAKARERR